MNQLYEESAYQGMSHMLDRTPRHRELHIGFKMLCEKLLTREGFMIMEAGWKQKNSRTPTPGADLVVKRPAEQETMIVEAKFYRSRRVDVALFRNALDELKRHRDTRKIKNALLITSAEITAAMRTEAEKQAITLWGLSDLMAMTAKTPTLGDTLSELLRDGDPGAAGHELFADELTVLEEQSTRQKTKAEGGKIAAEFDLVKPGPEGAKRFEQLCDKAVRYLFAEQFHRWATQNHGDDGLQRPDLIARLVPRHEFWISLSEDFRCRYVLFTFANAAEPLNQGIVLSAEKFLFPGALRSILFLITRAGLDAGARRAAQQILRDRGALILTLTLAELKDMLTARDIGDDFSDILIDRAAEALTDLNP